MRIDQECLGFACSIVLEPRAGSGQGRRIPGATAESREKRPPAGRSVRAFVGHMSISARRTGIALLLVVAMTGFAATFRAARREPAASPRTQNAQPDAQPGAVGKQRPRSWPAMMPESCRTANWKMRSPGRRSGGSHGRASLAPRSPPTPSPRPPAASRSGRRWEALTPKFRCVLPSGLEIRARYGQGPEIPAEAAATRLLAALGFGADTVTLIERLRCYGCPPEPFRTMKVVEATRTQPILERMVDAQQYRDFKWVGIERKFAARPIEAKKTAGWAFFELDRVDAARGGAPRAHVDALRLMAIVLAHWAQQVGEPAAGLPDPEPGSGTVPRALPPLERCRRDVRPGQGRSQAWEQAPVWIDRATCTVSMKELPHDGATFGSARISEAGRQFLVRLLGQLSDAQLAALFTSARFESADGFLSRPRPVSEWVRVFKQRVRAISDGSPCPAA